MSDNYEFTKSSIPQAIDDYSPYIDKQSNNYINDINGGVYTNNSLSLVTFDLGQIYNSSTFTDTNDLTLIVPVTMVAAYAAGGATVAADSTVTAAGGAGSEEEDEDGNAPEAKADLEADVDLDAGADLLSADVSAIAADEDEAPVTLAEGEDEEFEIIPPLYAQARRLFLEAEGN